MNATSFNLHQTRNKLADVLENFESLLNDLLVESENLTGDYAIKIFQQRFAILSAMVDAMVEYDRCVIQYIQFHPDSHNVKYYKDKLEVAKKYIQANGLDWSTVTWGKISDY